MSKYYNYIIILIFFSCSSECPKIEAIEKVGNKVMISMIECSSSKSLFDLKLNILVLENPNDSISNEKYVHIPKKEIELNSNKDFNYLVTIERSNNFYFTIGITLQNGNEKEILGTTFEKKKPKRIENKTNKGGWATTFIFDGKIEELENGIYKINITPSEAIEKGLNIFNSVNAKVYENHSFNLEISE